jgi:predicted amidohydrolase
VFQTDIGKIGILVCYDVEFPELSRYLAEKGMTLLCVPYWTDTKNAYLRVRRCAQARAIENECYVAISGSVGNLPKVENMDIQYAQSAVFTPSDFAFPHDAIAAEATPNTEMTLMVDLDRDLLKELRQIGSVRNLKSRRSELYEVLWKPDMDPDMTRQ